MNEVIGIAIGFGIGAACRKLDIPCPAPPHLMGAMLVVSITAGFVLCQWILA